MADERIVGGLSCSEVLALLPRYVEGELSSAELDHLATHLGGCENCTRFGGRYATLAAEVKRDLGPPEQLPPELEARLRAALERANQ
jgi:predicted anti-sigma-YlaC factor YlaD